MSRVGTLRILCLLCGFPLLSSAWGASFVVPNSDCLLTDCHGSNAPRQELDIEAQFSLDDGIGGYTNGSLLAQHNISYISDGNLNTIESAEFNECKKCHGAGDDHRYVSTGQWLAYPDDATAVGGGEENAAITQSGDYSTYQAFCISCHDGIDRGGSNPAAFTELAGLVPGQQVPPSLRSAPEDQQAMSPARLPSGGTWVVPAVPPKDVNESGPAYATTAPFLNYYETNGHGRATGLASQAMNVTCLSGSSSGGTPPPLGCHDPHSSANRFLLAGSLGASVDTAGEVAESVCSNASCHTVTVMGFHSLAPHADVTTSNMALFKSQNEVASYGNLRYLNLARSGTYATAIPPFYASEGTLIEDRTYGPTAADGSTFIHCLSCHDPHGTSTLWRQNDYGETGVFTPLPVHTQGMLRKFPVHWLTDTNPVDKAPDFNSDPLCNECHIE